MRSHEVDYEIFGNDMQVVEVELDLGETIVAGSWGDELDGGGHCL